MSEARLEYALNSRWNEAGSAAAYCARMFQSPIWNALGCGDGRGSMIGIRQRIGIKAVAECRAVRAEAAIFSI